MNPPTLPAPDGCVKLPPALKFLPRLKVRGGGRGIKVPLGRIDCGPGGLKGKRTGCSYGSLTSTQTVEQTCEISLDMGSNQYYL